jgi:hypothetical protein
MSTGTSFIYLDMRIKKGGIQGSFGVGRKEFIEGKTAVLSSGASRLNHLIL